MIFLLNKSLRLLCVVDVDQTIEEQKKINFSGEIKAIYIYTGLLIYPTLRIRTSEAERSISLSA